MDPANVEYGSSAPEAPGRPAEDRATSPRLEPDQPKAAQLDLVW